LKGLTVASVSLDESEIQNMKKHLLLFLGGSLLLCKMAVAQPAGPSPSMSPPEGYILVKATNSLPKFDLDFHGGTPKDLVKAIEKETDKPLNAIIPDDCADLKAQLFEVLIQASRKTQRYTVIDPRERSIGGNGSDVYVNDSRYGFSTVGVPTESSIWYFYWDRGSQFAPWQILSSTVCKFYQLEPYLNAGYTVEDITTAVETGWKMLGVTKQPEITYHKDTKVLIAVGDEDKVVLIGDVLKQLSITPKEKSNDKGLFKSKDQ